MTFLKFLKSFLNYFIYLYLKNIYYLTLNTDERHGIILTIIIVNEDKKSCLKTCFDIFINSASGSLKEFVLRLNTQEATESALY